MLLAMACVPQLMFFADQLPLFLVCRNRREAACYALASLVCFAAWLVTMLRSFDTVLPDPYALLGCYGTALYIVLRRPNEGTAPVWVERRIMAWPAWIRGRRAADTFR